MKIFGYVNDKEITQITLEFDDNNSTKELNYTLDSDRMFIFYWMENEDNYWNYKLKI